jgi:hypothetical protein
MKNRITSKKQKLFILMAEAGLWIILVLVMAWLWDHWFIPGPHGPERWVGMDFVPYWVGVRAMLHGQSPYSAGTTQAIQKTLLGGPPEPGGDPMWFVYPAWIFLVLVPLAILPLPWAVALWTGTLLWGTLHLIGFLALRWGASRPLPTTFWAIVLTIGSLPFLAISVTKGQLGLVSLGAILAAGLLWKRHPLAAGMMLGLAVLKPTLTVLPALGILIWALLERKFRLLAGFFLCMAVLLLASWLASGNWIPAYFRVLGNTGGAPILWSVTILPWPWKGLYVLTFAGLVVYAFIRLWRKHGREQWFSAMVLAGTALFPMRWIYDLLLGILVPAEAIGMTGFLAASVVAALLAPWGLAWLPADLRWPTLVVGLPILWAIVWIIQYIPGKRPDPDPSA